MMRHISLWSVLAFAFVLVMPAQAEEENTSAVVASVGVENITTHQEYDDVTISFDIINYGDSVESDIHYSIELFNMGENKEEQNDDYLVYHKNGEEVLFLPPGQKIHKEVKFTAPTYLGGDHQVWVRITNSSALRLSQMVAQQPLIFAIEGPSMSIDENTCKVFIKGEEENYGLADGIDVAPEDDLRVACKVNSTYFKAEKVLPLFTTYYRSLYGNVVGERPYSDDITIVPGEEEVIFEIPLAEDPQAYDVGIQLLGLDGEPLSNAIYAHYVLQGKSATIQNVKFDKGAYNSGDTASIELFWTPSADQFSSDIRRGEGSELSEETKALLTLTSDGKECAVATEEQLTSNSDTFTITVTKDCPHPSLALEIMDGDQALASGTFESGGEGTEETTSVEEDDEKRSTGIILLWVFGITALIIIIILIIRGKNGPKRGVKVLAFMVLAGGIFLMSSGNAEAGRGAAPICLDSADIAQDVRDAIKTKDIGSRSDISYVTCDVAKISNSSTVLVGGTGWGDSSAAYTISFSEDDICAGSSVRMTYDARDAYCTNGIGTSIGGLHIDAPSGQTDEWLVDFEAEGVGDVTNVRTSNGYRDYTFSKEGTYTFTFKGYGNDRSRALAMVLADWRTTNHIPGHMDEQPMTKTITVQNCNPATCGTADNTTRTTAPSTNAEKCSIGISSAISSNVNSWTWSCSKTELGVNTTDTCSAAKDIVDGVCGTNHQKYTNGEGDLWTSAGVDFNSGTYCEKGNYASNGLVDGKYTWTCQKGTVLGKDVSCYATAIECEDPVVNVDSYPEGGVQKDVALIAVGEGATIEWDMGGADSCTRIFPYDQAGSSHTWVPGFAAGSWKSYTLACENPGVASDGKTGFGTCSGSDTATITKCKAGQEIVVDGSGTRSCKYIARCGIVNNTSFPLGSPPNTNLCDAASVVSSLVVSGKTPQYWQWQCQNASGGASVVCHANLEPACSTINAINDDNAYNTNYSATIKPAPDNRCAAGIASEPKLTDQKWEWTCTGIDDTAGTKPCFVRYACPTDKLQCDKGNQCLDIDALDGTAMLTKDGVSGSQTMSVNIVNGDDPTPIVCSSNSINCTVEVDTNGFEVDDFTILGGQSSGTYDIDGGELSDYVKADNGATLLTINSVECKITENDTTWASEDSAELVFTCLGATCEGEGENVTCKKTPKTNVSSIDDCVKECTSIGECTSSTGTIKEVQP